MYLCIVMMFHHLGCDYDLLRMHLDGNCAGSILLEVVLRPRKWGKYAVSWQQPRNDSQGKDHGFDILQAMPTSPKMSHTVRSMVHLCHIGQCTMSLVVWISNNGVPSCCRQSRVGKKWTCLNTIALTQILGSMLGHYTVILYIIQDLLCRPNHVQSTSSLSSVTFSSCLYCPHHHLSKKLVSVLDFQGMY
jgi:hypothetical protein